MSLEKLFECIESMSCNEVLNAPNTPVFQAFEQRISKLEGNDKERAQRLLDAVNEWRDVLKEDYSPGNKTPSDLPKTLSDYLKTKD